MTMPVIQRILVADDQIGQSVATAQLPALHRILPRRRRKGAGAELSLRVSLFQHELPKPFAQAHGVFLSRVGRIEQIPESERLNPERVVTERVWRCSTPVA